MTSRVTYAHPGRLFTRCWLTGGSTLPQTRQDGAT